MSLFFVLQVRIRESNFHSSLIQGAQNFDLSHQQTKTVVSDGEKSSGSRGLGVKLENNEKMLNSEKSLSHPISQQPAAASADTNDNKMPVEQLTSHVLSSVASNPNFKAVNSVTTLIILVSAFLGRENCMKIYDDAIQRKFRFFSYGDSMLAFRPTRSFRKKI